jgi:DNA topoisomerase-1
LKKNPAAPFTTSTLQQEASRKLSMGVSQTMRVAQKLYEAGHITYMRTDSVAMSKVAQTQATNLIIDKRGKEYSDPKTYKGKSSNTQEAHECIRPTNFGTENAGSTSQEKRLYELIRKRTLASQMSSATGERTKASIIVSNHKTKLFAEGEVISFP